MSKEEDKEEGLLARLSYRRPHLAMTVIEHPPDGGYRDSDEECLALLISQLLDHLKCNGLYVTTMATFHMLSNQEICDSYPRVEELDKALRDYFSFLRDEVEKEKDRHREQRNADSPKTPR